MLTTFLKLFRPRTVVSASFVVVIFGVISLGVAVSSAVAATASRPAWGITSLQAPTNFSPGDNSGIDRYTIIVTNIGGQSTDGALPLTVVDTLPTGLTTTAISAESDPNGDTWSCDLSTLTCTYIPGSSASPGVAAGQQLPVITVTVSVAVNAPPSVTNVARVSGGDGSNPIEASADDPTTISSSPAGFGIQPSSFTATVNNADGSLDTQAGSHPYSATTSFAFNTFGSGNFVLPVERVKNVEVALPPGFVGNPQATPKCSVAALAEFNCPRESMVGIAVLGLSAPGIQDINAVYNMQPNPGTAATFAFYAEGQVPVFVYAKVRSGGDYGLTAYVENTPHLLGVPVYSSSLTFWGIPADHNGPGPLATAQDGFLPSVSYGGPGGGPRTAFLTNPTTCAASPLTTGLNASSYEDPGALKSYATTTPPVTGCERLHFDPTISLTPDTTQAASPAGLAVDLNVPQTDSPNTLATPELRNVAVTLPQGMTVSPSSADGLNGCSDAQIALTSSSPGNCPDASQIGTATIHTPLLDHTLPGTVYLGTPQCGPCTDADAQSGRMLRLFIQVNDPISGIVVKLPGTVSADPQTGQLTASFKDNPQLPFDDLKLNFKGGPRAPLATPPTCGAFHSHTVLSPWSAPFTPDAVLDSPMTINQNCGRAAEFTPSFSAGTTNPVAGSFSSFTLNLNRPDGQQNIAGINVTLPPGQLAKLAGVPLCPATAAATAACPSASQIGTTTVAVGAGSAPLYIPQPGKAPTAVYLSGPYKGAPYSLAVKVPAQAGPFDLGTVAVRSALYVDPATAQVTAKADPLPQILAGVPLSYQKINVTLDRPDFTLNPTNCDQMAVTGQISSDKGAVANVSNRYQVGDCAALGFKPNLTLALKGGTKRSQHPALKSVINYPKKGSYANIARAAVTLPVSEFIDQAHIGNPCIRPDFAAEKCPKLSVLGRAKAWTPLLDKPLEGKVYFRSNGGERELPDIVANLKGQIHIVLVGFVDEKHKKGSESARIRTTFAQAPDAPVSKFVLELKGGKEGLLVNSTNLCKAPDQAIVKLTAQNGKTYDTTPAVANSCGKKSQGKKKSSKRLGTSHR